MPDQKLDNLLNLALDATEEEREKSRNLNVGYEKQTRKWEIIVKYSEMGDSVEALLGGPEISVVPLLGRYAIVTLPESMLDEYSRRPQIEFIEKPTRLYFEDLFSKEASCITQVQRNEPGNLRLTGRGVLIGIVDSGVDYRHPAFLTADGKSRILRLWDQSIPGNPPEGYATGTEYTNEKINEALSLSVQEGRRLVRLKMEAVMEPLCLDFTWRKLSSGVQSIISIVPHSYTNYIFPHAGHAVQVSFQQRITSV